MMSAIDALRAWHGEFPRAVTVLLVSDEEVGSESSRVITEILARNRPKFLSANLPMGRKVR